MKILDRKGYVRGEWPSRVKGSGVMIGHGKVRYLVPMKWAVFKRRKSVHVEPVLEASDRALKSLGLA